MLLWENAAIIWGSIKKTHIQIIYEFSLKYFKSYFVTMLIKLRCNKRNLSGSV